MTKRIVLLPGLDGTGRLFEEFAGSLPANLRTTIISYPPDRLLRYAELRDLVINRLPISEPFALLGESFSAPVAVQIAATNPANLTGLVLSSGFVYRPVGAWTKIAEELARPWIFALDPPRFIAKYFAIGMDAPAPVVERALQVWKTVRPEVLSGRAQEGLRADARGALAKTSVPLLYLHGRHDHLLARDCLRQITRIRPDAEVSKVSAPHMLLQRAPDWGATVVTKFLSGLRE